MKPTLLFATLSLVFAMPQAMATTELETLRARCIEQERQIRRLEEQVAQLKPATERTTPVASKAAAVEGTTYKVRPGDCIEKIARKAGCSPTKLAKANGIKVSAIIHPGQTMKLPGTAIARTETPLEKPALTAAKETSTSAAASSYTIKQGDTYASISRKTRISVDTLIAANPAIKPTALRPGQMIRLSPASAPAPQLNKTVTPIAKAPASTHTVLASTPVKHTSAPEHTPAVSQPAEKPAAINPPAAPAPSVPPTSSPASASAESKAPVAAEDSKTSPSNPEKKIRSVTIEGEMTYGEFASKHGTDTNRLNDLNGLDLTHATVLAKGSELYVPAQP